VPSIFKTSQQAVPNENKPTLYRVLTEGSMSREKNHKNFILQNKSAASKIKIPKVNIKK
jgi:hypothetical protein